MFNRILKGIKSTISATAYGVNYAKQTLIYTAIIGLATFTVSIVYLLSCLGFIAILPILMLNSPNILQPFEKISQFPTIISNNFKHNILRVSNYFLKKFQLPEFDLEFRTNREALNKAIKTRERRIIQNQKISDICKQYKQELIKTELELEYSPSSCVNISYYKNAETEYIKRALEEYTLFAKKLGIDAYDSKLLGGPEQIKSLKSWYMLRTRDRLVEWTFYKSFALELINQNKDFLVYGLKEKQIANLEKNEKWCCSLSSQLMRTPVYIELKNKGDIKERVYFDFLNLEKWLSRPVANDKDREISPITRERIDEVYLDFEMMHEIKIAIAKEKNNINRIATDNLMHKSYKKVFNYLFESKSKFLECFESYWYNFMTITTLNTEMLEKLADPYNTIRVNDFVVFEAINKPSLTWQQMYEKSKKLTNSEIDDIFFKNTIASGVTVFDIIGYERRGDQNIPLLREVQILMTRNTHLNYLENSSNNTENMLMDHRDDIENSYENAPEIVNNRSSFNILR